jgi:hypothetical protein
MGTRSSENLPLAADLLATLSSLRVSADLYSRLWKAGGTTPVPFPPEPLTGNLLLDLENEIRRLLSLSSCLQVAWEHWNGNGLIRDLERTPANEALHEEIVAFFDHGLL